MKERFQRAKKLHVVLTVYAEMGHFICIVHLMRALEKAGHTCTLLTNNYERERCTNIHAQFDLKGKILFPDEKLNFDREHYMKGFNKDQPNKVFPISLDPKVLEPFIAAMRDEKPDIIISDYVSLFGVAAANTLNLPLMVNMSLNLDSLMVKFTNNPIRQRYWGTNLGCLCICPHIFDFFFDQWNKKLGPGQP